MAESNRAVLVLRLYLSECRLWDCHTTDDHKRDGEYGHTDEQERSHIAHTRVLGDGTYEDTSQQRGQRTRQRVHRTTDLNQLVTLVATTSEKVQHRVDDGVQHTDAETADECSEQIDQQIESHRDVVIGEDISACAYET